MKHLVTSCAVWLLTGCGQVLGIDEFRTGPTPDVDKPCGALEVPLGGGKCAPVGVADCGSFRSDGNGGCNPLLPSTPCPAGEYAEPDSTECAPLVTCAPSGQRGMLSAEQVYVREGATNGKGTATAPFGTIEEALSSLSLEQMPRPTLPAIAVDNGDYSVNLDLTFPVLIFGNCPTMTRLVAADTSKPVVTIEPRAKGSTLQYMKIVGGSSGVAIDGADSTLANLWITDSEGPGVSATIGKPAEDGSSTPITIQFTTVVVDGAFGAGVLSYGANLEIDTSTVSGTQDPGPGPDSGGVCIRPSPWVPNVQEADGPYRDPRRVFRPTLTMARSVLEDNAGAGLSIVGADATVTSSVVRSTAPTGAPEQRIGIDVAEHPFGNVPATLVLKQSVVDGAGGEGIRIHDATASLENVVIRNVGAAPTAMDQTRCLGSGIRFRWDRPSPGASAPLAVTTSLVENTRDTGILVEGAAAKIQGSIVRNTAKDPCAGDLGDGVGVYGYSFASASLDLETSRVDGSARAAVTVFGGPAVTSVAVTSAVLSAAESLVRDDSSPVPKLSHALCGKSGDEACAPEQRTVMPSLLGFGAKECDPDNDTVCISACNLNSGVASPVPIQDVRWTYVGHDEIAPAVTGRDGCGVMEGLPRNSEVVLLAVQPMLPAETQFDSNLYDQAYVPGSALITTGTADRTEPLTLPADTSLAGFRGLLAVAQGIDQTFDWDLRNAPIGGIWVCASHPEQVPPGTDVCRDAKPGNGVYGIANVQVTLDPPPEFGPLYAVGGIPSVATATPDDSLGALATPFGITTGESTVHLTSAVSGKTLHCALDTSHGPTWGGAAGENAFRIVATPGVTPGLYAFCSLE